MEDIYVNYAEFDRVEDDASTVKGSKNVYQKFEAYFLSKNM